MLDGEVPEKVEKVWGFAVQTRSSGRRHWPDKLRGMAADRIKAGQGIREIAEEIGANKALVAHWVKKAQCKVPRPAFFEVVPPTKVKASAKQATTITAPDEVTACGIRIGDTDVAIPPDYPADHLEAILRAVRASQ